MDARIGQVKRIKARLAEERGTLCKEAPLRLALCYPSPYHVGMSSLGYQSIYRAIHRHPLATAERAFLPDPEGGGGEESARVSLLTYETQSPVGEFPVLAFSVACEVELTGLLEMLRLAGIPLLREARTERHPLVIAGGPLTFANARPLEPFVDLLVKGEACDAIDELLQVLAERGGGPRGELFLPLVGRPGFWVPGQGTLDSGAVACARASDMRLPAASQIVTPNTELRSMFLIEAARGCSRSCAYCVMRRSSERGGLRLVPMQSILAAIPEDARKVGLVGAAVTDHPELGALLRALVDSGREVGISSLRADRLDEELVGLLAKAGYRTLTTAIDGLSERVRASVERRTSEESLFEAARLARAQGMKRLKLYAMVGLPGERDEEVEELAALSRELSKLLPLSLAVSPFVPKQGTPLADAPFAPLEVLDGRLMRLKRALKGRAELRSTSSRWAWIEYRLSQGDARAGLAAMRAWERGGAYSAWVSAFAENE